MKFMLIIVLTISLMGKDSKTIKFKIPQETKKECLKTAKTFHFKLTIPGVVLSIKSRCEPKTNKDKPGITQV